MLHVNYPFIFKINKTGTPEGKQSQVVLTQLLNYVIKTSSYHILTLLSSRLGPLIVISILGITSRLKVVEG